MSVVDVEDFLCFQCPRAESSQYCKKVIGLCGKDEQVQHLNRNILASLLSISLRIQLIEHQYIDLPDPILYDFFYSLSLVPVSQNYDPSLCLIALSKLVAAQEFLDDVIESQDLSIPHSFIYDWDIGSSISDQLSNGESFNSSFFFSHFKNESTAALFEFCLTLVLPPFGWCYSRLWFF
ncbi:hypothetical protein GEMRC1_012096 [Eukaryota sp. GEM-RC1]